MSICPVSGHHVRPCPVPLQPRGCRSSQDGSQGPGEAAERPRCSPPCWRTSGSAPRQRKAPRCPQWGRRTLVPVCRWIQELSEDFLPERHARAAVRDLCRVLGHRGAGMGTVAAPAPLSAPIGAAPAQTSPHEPRALCQPLPLWVLQLWVSLARLLCPSGPPAWHCPSSRHRGPPCPGVWQCHSKGNSNGNAPLRPWEG